MGQEEIIKLLEEEGKPLSRGEISLALNKEAKYISTLLKQLLKYNEVRAKEIDKDKALKNYHCKRKMRLYFIK
jgi:hypothetical protein